MIQTIKKVLTNGIAAVVLSLSLVAVVAPAVSAQEAIQNNLCAGVNINPGGAGDGCDESTGTAGFGELLTDIINILSFIIGFVAVVMIIIGGFKYITSNGDSNSITSAKNTILYAIIGLVIVALAQVIVRFVLGSVSSL